MTHQPALSGLSAIAENYDVLLCDIWGVLHNGLQRYPKAVEALVTYRQSGGKVALVTNAPRPRGPIIQMLDRLQVVRDAYDVIVSSGDVTRTLIRQHEGGTVHNVGPEHDLPLYDGINVTRGDAADATAVVVTDLDDRTHEKLSDYDERLQFWLSRDLPLICANPDKVVEIGDQMIICGGSLAERYEQMGGTVLMAGKPYAPIYEEALRLLGTDAPRDRMLAIGDAVHTDAHGAAGQGVHFLFITGSVHAAEIEAAGEGADELVTRLIAPSGAHLVGHMPELAW